eukprot:3884770-Amphidinium_carterae.1
MQHDCPNPFSGPALQAIVRVQTSPSSHTAMQKNVGLYGGTVLLLTFHYSCNFKLVTVAPTTYKSKRIAKVIASAFIDFQHFVIYNYQGTCSRLVRSVYVGSARSFGYELHAEGLAGVDESACEDAAENGDADDDSEDDEEDDDEMEDTTNKVAISTVLSPPNFPQGPVCDCPWNKLSTLSSIVFGSKVQHVVSSIHSHQLVFALCMVRQQAKREQVRMTMTMTMMTTTMKRARRNEPLESICAHGVLPNCDMIRTCGESFPLKCDAAMANKVHAVVAARER